MRRHGNGGAGGGQGAQRGIQPQISGASLGSGSGKVDLRELSWEDKERVLRLLFAKINQSQGQGQVSQQRSYQSTSYDENEVRWCVLVNFVSKVQTRERSVGPVRGAVRDLFSPRETV